MTDYAQGPSFRVPAGMNVIVFDGSDYAGESHVLKGSPDLRCQTLGNFSKDVGANSSLWIVSDSKVLLHETDDCSGTEIKTLSLAEGQDYKEIGWASLNAVSWNDRARSMRIAQDVKLEACNGNNCVNVSKR